MAIGKLERVPLRELWKHEEMGFSAWLENNIEALSETVGLSLSAAQREKKVGSFEVDLIAEYAEGNLAIIENQLEPTNHDHLGKVLTYLTNLEAKTAIWITSEPRPEHIVALSWLNKVTPGDIGFYLVQLDAYRIGNSDPAPLFTLIVGPSDEGKDIGREREELAERHILRLKFWEQLLQRAKEKGVTLHSARSPTKEYYLSAGAGKAGLSFTYSIRLEDTSIELYIDTGKRDENKGIFDKLVAHREKIEKDFGGSLIWERLDDKRASFIRFPMRQGGLRDESNWAIIQETMIDAMQRLSNALMPHLRTLGR